MKALEAALHVPPPSYPWPGPREPESLLSFLCAGGSSPFPEWSEVSATGRQTNHLASSLLPLLCKWQKWSVQAPVWHVPLSLFPCGLGVRADVGFGPSPPSLSPAVNPSSPTFFALESGTQACFTTKYYMFFFQLPKLCGLSPSQNSREGGTVA